MILGMGGGLKYSKIFEIFKNLRQNTSFHALDLSGICFAKNQIVEGVY